MVRNAQKMISRMFFIVGYFPHLGGVNEVWKISTQFFFFEGFPNDVYGSWVGYSYICAGKDF